MSKAPRKITVIYLMVYRLAILLPEKWLGFKFWVTSCKINSTGVTLDIQCCDGIGLNAKCLAPKICIQVFE